jgi:hypothetical protein
MQTAEDLYDSTSLPVQEIEFILGPNLKEIYPVFANKITVWGKFLASNLRAELDSIATQQFRPG